MAPGSKNTGIKLIKSSTNTPFMWGGRYPPGDPRWKKDYLTGPKLSMIRPKI
jgi:hypothetical protein